MYLGRDLSWGLEAVAGLEFRKASITRIKSQRGLQNGRQTARHIMHLYLFLNLFDKINSQQTMFVVVTICNLNKNQVQKCVIHNSKRIIMIKFGLATKCRFGVICQIKVT